MKLLRYGPQGEEKPGCLDEIGTLRDLSNVISDVAGAALSPESLAKLQALDLSAQPAVDAATRIGACVGNVGKIICIGLNYSDHAAETGADIPEEPLIFGKATSAITGPFDHVVIPKGSTQCDWEAELAIVIGTEAKNVSEADALHHVAGYCIMNDVSERHWQKDRGGQWIKGKSADTFAPLGPWLVTKDEIADPNALSIWLEVDGERKQDGNTANMIFSVPHIVAYLSQFMSLQPGDIISTGTPAGVGLGFSPPQFLKPGQTMRLGVEGLGEQKLTVAAAG